MTQQVAERKAAEPKASDRWPIEDLVGPYGPIGEPRPMDGRGWLPPNVTVYQSTLGDLGWLRGQEVPEYLGGAGRTIDDPDLARKIAICEGAERYGSLYPRTAVPIVATGRELGDRALPMTEVARSGADELRRAKSPFVQPDPDARIRWIEAVELTRRRPAFVPAVMVRVTQPINPQELFWLPMSTGSAIHRTQVRAIVCGIHEVIERDSLSVAWLRKLRLPRLDPSVVPPGVERIMAWYTDRGVTVRLFDTTSDLGVPTVLCVVDAPDNPKVSQCIGSASGFDLPDTVTKAALEGTGLYAALMGRHKPLLAYQDFADPMASAFFMGRPSRRKAFSFLLDGDRPVSLPATHSFASPEDELAFLLRLFAARGMDVYATDVTPREVEPIGWTVSHVVIPALQPASLHPWVQYKAHSRLRHDHPFATGPQRVRDLNGWPLPLS